MKIELKNIQHSPSHSPIPSMVTQAFTASLYIEGVHVAIASNCGQGGNTDYHAIDAKYNKVIKRAEAHCKSLPPKQYPPYIIGGKAMESKVTLESYINDLFYDYLNKKFLAKLHEHQLREILYGNLDKSYVFGLRLQQTFAELPRGPNGEETIVRLIQEKVLPQLKEGEKILNQNIPEPLLIKSGLSKGQYVIPIIQSQRQLPKKKAQTKKKEQNGLTR